MVPGTPVRVCAKCVNPDHPVPYLAVILWSQDSAFVNPGLVDNLMSQPADQILGSLYLESAEQLLLQVQQQQRPALPGPHHQDVPVGPHRHPGDQLAPPPPTKRFCGGSGGRRSLSDHNREGRQEQFSEPRHLSFVVTNLSEEFPERGTKAVVDKYFSRGVGQLSVVNSSGKKLQKVLFHVNHVWKSLDNSFGKHNSNGHTLFLESNTYEELEKQLDIGSTVSLNARKISGAELPLQATAVWVSTQPPANYKTPQLVADLALKLNDFIYSQTGDEKCRSNPLCGAPDSMVAGELKEYVSFEMGLIVLQNGHTALFHLNQVWTDSKSQVLLKTTQDKLLEQYLPLGAKVWLNFIEIPAGKHSDLKYQATIVYRRREGSDNSIPKAYIEKFQPYEARVALVAELNVLHDLFKKNLRKHRPVTNTNFIPVHVVLNGLPKDWTAEIVAAVDEDFGIIKISSSQGLARGVNFIYSLFHIEDVYDFNGLPAIQNPNINMKNLMNCQVNLTARSICISALEPEKLIDVQRDLLDGGSENGAIPLLQAVVVCLKVSANSTTNTENIPKPTCIREKPNSFGNLGSLFYLNPLLFAKLDIKLKEFLAIRKKLNLPYDKIIKSVSIGKNHEKSMLETYKELDVNRSYKFIYGELPTNMPEVPNTKGLMPRILTKHPVKIVYIHRNKLKAECGVLELEVDVGDEKLTTYAFFELSKYKFFTPPDSFARDLANIMRVSSTDKFCIHAMFARPGSRIPYVALAVWNEDLRTELRADVPLDFTADTGYANSTKWAVKEIVSLLKQPEPIIDPSQNLVDPAYPTSIPVPDHIGTVTSDVKHFDGNKVQMDNRGIVTLLNNITGYIEKVLTDHLAIARFKHREKMYKVLVSSDDVFLLDISEKFNVLRDFQLKNKLKFSSATELWSRTAAKLKKSLFDVFEIDQKVTLNALPLLSVPETNNADIWYISAGVVVTREYRQHVTVPVNCIYSSKKVTENFKMYFMKVISNVSSSGMFEPESIPGEPPAKFPPDFYEGAKSKFSLRNEYVESTGGPTKKSDNKKVATAQIPKSVSLPAPVSVKKPPPKPIPWDPIITTRYGRVLRVVDKNYGIAASYFPLYEDSNECEPFQFLFDIFDIYIGEKDCNDLGKKLPDVLSIGDFVKFNAVKVEMEVAGTSRDIRYLATSMITDTAVEDIRDREIPGNAPVISDIEQVTASKVNNFKVVAGFLSNIPLASEEEDVLNDIRSGGLLAKFASRLLKPRVPSPIVIEPEVDNEDGSDEEITVIETVSDTRTSTVEVPVGDLKQKQLRNLISTYNKAVNKHAQNKTRGKYCLRELKEETKLGCELSFFEEFLLCLGRKCQEVKKGFKVGHIFVTNFQVNSILSYGVISKDDIDNKPTEKREAPEDYKEILKKFPFSKLRKFIIDFHNYLSSRLSLGEVSRNAELTMEQTRQLMGAVGEAVEKAPVEEGKVQGMKVNNIFISSSWVIKIQENHRKQKFG